ncbi:MAG: PqqD family protein [Thermoanaerobaculales bacterium]|nr:PqqD family protein [Thermoanaerobaculales bacterium]
MVAQWELGELLPIRLAEWVEKDGVVVVRCPRPTGRGFRDLQAWFSWWTGPQRIRLDEIGSAAWRLFDGETTLGRVTEVLENEMNACDGEAMEDRVDLFVRVLLRERMLELRA